MAENEENKRPLEKLLIKSGAMLVIDQYMLGNKQFVEKLEFNSGFSSSIEKAADLFGGAVVPVANGEYQVDRDSLESLICLHPGQDNGEDRQAKAGVQRDSFKSIGRVFVDTRCVVFADAELVNDKALLDEYRQTRLGSGEKSARDLLRGKGASVKYGFNRFGDELGIFQDSSSGSVALWPDVVEDINQD